MTNNSIEKLERRLGYTFTDKTHLQLALTHRSHSDKNYERLEFLGDSILNFVIAESLFHRFGEASEGELSRLRARMVKQPTLAELAREMDIGPMLTMGSGELKSGGFERDSILSDALEAIIGAMLLDSGFEVARENVQRWFEPRLGELSPDDLNKDAKSRLQEYLQSRGHPLPEYNLIGSWGKSPRQEFEVECSVGDLATPLSARGPSKRSAEQQAAELILEALGENK